MSNEIHPVKIQFKYTGNLTAMCIGIVYRLSQTGMLHCFFAISYTPEYSSGQDFSGNYYEQINNNVMDIRYCITVFSSGFFLNRLLSTFNHNQLQMNL